MLDGECSFTTLDDADQIDIWWGAFLGMENELIAAGRLDQVADQIIATRAKGRADHGWIMDIYLMRRRA
jgi:precorrin-6A synthase